MTITVQDAKGTRAYPEGGGSGSSAFLIGPTTKNAPYQSLADAVADAVAQAAAEPIFYCLTGGDYTDDVTLPANSSVIGLDRPVGILGQITTAKADNEVVRFENIAFFQGGGGLALDADYGGLGFDQPIILLDNCFFALSNGSTGVRAAGVSLEASGQLVLELNDGIGIDLIGPDAGDPEPTELVANFIQVGMDSANDIAIQTGDGAGGTDVIGIQIERLSIESRSEGTGVRINNTSDASIVNGMKIGTFEWRGNDAVGGIAIDFVSGAASHSIGVFMGDTVSDTLFAYAGANTGQTLSVGDLQFGISASGNPRTSFVVANLDGSGALIIQGGVVSMGDDVCFDIDGGQIDPTLIVENVDFLGAVDPGGSVLLFDAPCNSFNVQFKSCRFNLDGNAGDPKFQMNGEGAPAATGRQLRFEDCLIDSTGTDVVVDITNCDLTLSNTEITQNDAANDAVRINATGGGQTSVFVWTGFSQILRPVAPGGGGVCLNMAADGNIQVGEGGVLDLSGPRGEALELNGGGQDLSLGQLVGPRVVATGNLATWVNNDFLVGFTGEGVPSSYPGLHIVATAHFKYIGGGGGNESTNEITVTNQETTLSETATMGSDVADGTQIGSTRALSNDGLLVAPGDRILVQVTTATTASVDNEVVLS